MQNFGRLDGKRRLPKNTSDIDMCISLTLQHIFLCLSKLYFSDSEIQPAVVRCAGFERLDGNRWLPINTSYARPEAGRWQPADRAGDASEDKFKLN